MTTPFWRNAETWTTRDGRVLKLEEMDASHRENLIAWVRRRLGRIRFEEEMYWLAQVAGHDGGDAAHDALEHEMYFAMEAPVDEFLESLPLVKALRRLADLEKPLDPTPWTARAGVRRTRRRSYIFNRFTPAEQYRQTREDYAAR